MKSKYCSIIFITSLLIQSMAHAQLPSLEKGTLIRVTTSQYQYPIIATVETISADSLSCFATGRLLKFSADEIIEIETKTLPQRHTIEGAMIGLFSGALLMGAFGYLMTREEGTYLDFSNSKEKLPIAMAVGAAIGALGGGAVGYSKITKNKKWQERFPEERIEPFIPGEKSPVVACIRSLVPGGGQFYNGDRMKGLIQQIVFLSGIVVAMTSSEEKSTQELIGIGMISGSWLWSIIDAPLSAMKKNKSLKEKKSENKIQPDEVHVNFGLNVSNIPYALFAQVSYSAGCAAPGVWPRSLIWRKYLIAENRIFGHTPGCRTTRIQLARQE